MLITKFFFHHTIKIIVALYLALFLGANIARGYPLPVYDPENVDHAEGMICSYLEFTKNIKIKDIFQLMANIIKKTNNDADITDQNNIKQKDSKKKYSENSHFKLWDDLTNATPNDLTLISVIEYAEKTISPAISPPPVNEYISLFFLTMNAWRLITKRPDSGYTKEEQIALSNSCITRMTFKKDNQTLFSLHCKSPKLPEGFECTENAEKQSEKETELNRTFHSLRFINMKEQYHQPSALTIGKYSKEKNHQTCKLDNNSFINTLLSQQSHNIFFLAIYMIQYAADMEMLLSIYFTTLYEKHEGKNSGLKDKAKALANTEKTADSLKHANRLIDIDFAKFVNGDNVSFNQLKNCDISLTLEYKKATHYAATGSDSDSKEPDSKESAYIPMATIRGYPALYLLTLATTTVACQHLLESIEYKKEQTISDSQNIKRTGLNKRGQKLCNNTDKS